jgi:hypothetical protein
LYFIRLSNINTHSLTPYVLRVMLAQIDGLKSKESMHFQLIPPTCGEMGIKWVSTCGPDIKGISRVERKEEGG